MARTKNPIRFINQPTLKENVWSNHQKNRILDTLYMQLHCVIKLYFTISTAATVYLFSYTLCIIILILDLLPSVFVIFVVLLAPLVTHK